MLISLHNFLNKKLKELNLKEKFREINIRNINFWIVLITVLLILFFFSYFIFLKKQIEEKEQPNAGIEEVQTANVEKKEKSRFEEGVKEEIKRIEKNIDLLDNKDLDIEKFDNYFDYDYLQDNL